MEDNVFSYINGMNATFLEEVYERYLKDPLSIDPSWRGFFAGMSLVKDQPLEKKGDVSIIQLIEAYRKHGHKKTLCNPLQKDVSSVPELNPQFWGISSEDLSSEVATFGFLQEKRAPLQELIQALEERYCNGIGFEIEGLSVEIDEWIKSHIEKQKLTLTKEEELLILDDIMQAELFETFIHTKYPGQTRFSLEGGETFIPLLRCILEYGAKEGIEEVVLGMAHRGRLNVLTSILGKSYAEIFEEFEDGDYVESSGDVKYHKGVTSEVKVRSGEKVAVFLAPNPSHLESINPVVEGQVRAKQDIRKDSLACKKVVALLVHGDASLSGQGVIYETLQMARLEGYKTGGTLHVVINNHIGYTTLPKDGRSTLYCTDIAKAFGCPVFHVSAEKPLECIEAALLAVKLRQTFGVDVFIDLNCYRKYGHNEGDEPGFTQPIEYQKIKEKRSIRKLLEKRLIEDKVIKEEEVQRKEEAFHKELLEILQDVTKKDRFQKSFEKTLLLTPPHQERLSLSRLQEIAKKICEVPKHFSLHRKLQKVLVNRLKMCEEPQRKILDWAMAEQLAYASLLEENIAVRLSGQDVGRGTFSHRHAAWIDQTNGERYVPLQHLKEGQVLFSLYDSFLSEFAVMGFDMGYSIAHPSCLVLWEAQYGDFYNSAQVIVDQYLSASEKKWSSHSNMVLLLPHGYEGKGPEHSSARIERFLQLCAEENFTVANCTTPSQFFHLLRRQAYLTQKKPLIVFTPKMLLRLANCVSSLEELANGAFAECLGDVKGNSQAKKLILCSGKVFYDLLEEREARKAEEVAILRIEQLYPFPVESLKALLQPYRSVISWVWVQEEPKNMGAWSYMQNAWLTNFSDKPLLQYVGREESASPATGSYATHKKQYKEFMQKAFTDSGEKDHGN